MRIQYVSDLHLEHHKIARAEQLNPRMWIKPAEGADVLVLAGDIGWPDLPAYGLFIEWCSANWPAVVLVAGNHEFYTRGATGGIVPGPVVSKMYMGEKRELIRLIARALPNVHFLDRGKVKIGGVWFLGTTLWSEIPPDMYKNAALGLNDFRMILTGPNRLLTVADYAAMHRADVEWLERELLALRATDQTAVVVTHHMPTPALIHQKYVNEPLNCCFASDLEWLLEAGQPAAWICGHSHTGNLITLGKVVLALNPVGYPGERVETRTAQAVMEVKGQLDEQLVQSGSAATGPVPPQESVDTRTTVPS